MTLGMPLTVLILLAAFALFGFAWWRRRQPFDPLRVSMVNYRHLQFIAIVVAVLMGAHLVTLVRAALGFGGAP